MGLLDKWNELKGYIDANTPRATRPVARPGQVINQGLLNPNKYNEDAANRFKDSAFGLLGVVPGLGDAASGVEAADLWNRGEKGFAALAGLGALPLVPAMGGMIKVYHGSPHKFDKFDMSKIGTGEGAQAYGHGLYFAESPEVAKSYMNAGIGYDTKGGWDAFENLFKPLIPELDSRMLELDPVWKYRKAAGIESDTTPFQIAYRHINYGEKLRGLESDNAVQEAIKILKENPVTNLYEVNLRWPDAAREAADPLGPQHFLDWDKPLSEQPQMVRDALSRYGVNDAKTGDDIYWQLKRKKYGVQESMPASPLSGEAQAFASELLRQQGIPGIRYLDGMGRGAGEGSSNYVVFDDALAEIIKRNGGLLGQ